MSVEFVDEQGGKAAIADVRSDSTPTDWVLFSYENAKSQKIVLVGSGSGGVSELLSNLSDDIVGYGLVRKSDKIDDSVTVKFAFIMWLGDNVPRMQKARISIHQGKMKEWIGQYHVDINASHKDELSDQILMEKIMDFSGSGSRVLDKTTGAKQLSSQASASATSGNKPSQTTNKAKQGLEWSDQAALKDAIQQVRNDNDPTTWVLFTYDGDDSNNIVLLAKGNGNVNDEVVPHLKDNAVVYGLVRKIEQVDDSQTVKFAFFRFVGDNINRMLRARLGTHFGAVTAFFHPYHVTIDATSASEVSDETIVKTIKIAAGTAVHVQDVVRPTPTVTSNTTSSSNAPTKTSATGVRNPVIPKSVPTSDNQAVKYKDEQDTKDLIRDVRSDSTSTNWCLVGYEGGKGNVLVSLGKGDGGVEELKSHLQDNIVAYGLVRKTEKIDDSVTVKFAFIYWTGENIDRMHRARIGTHTGAVSSLFTPYHTDLKVTQLNELSDEIIQTRIGEASGTKSHVKS